MAGRNVPAARSPRASPVPGVAPHRPTPSYQDLTILERRLRRTPAPSFRNTPHRGPVCPLGYGRRSLATPVRTSQSLGVRPSWQGPLTGSPTRTPPAPDADQRSEAASDAEHLRGL